MSEYIELIGSNGTSLKLSLPIAKLCGTFVRMFEMTETPSLDEGPIKIPVPFNLEAIGGLLYDYLSFHQDNPEFSRYTTIGSHGNYMSTRFEQWKDSIITQQDEAWVSAISDPLVLHNLYSIADFLEIPSLMDLIAFNLSTRLFEELYCSKPSNEKAIYMRTILIGNV